jgi:hypothetical protein
MGFRCRGGSQAGDVFAAADEACGGWRVSAGGLGWYEDPQSSGAMTGVVFFDESGHLVGPG